MHVCEAFGIWMIIGQSADTSCTWQSLVPATLKRVGWPAVGLDAWAIFRRTRSRKGDAENIQNRNAVVLHGVGLRGGIQQR